MTRVLLVSACLAVSASAGGQAAPRAAVPSAPATAPQADSAAEARLAYRRGIAAYRSHDLPTAVAEMRRAATAWPTQQAYLEAAASLAALVRDTADAAHWLDRLADLGVGGNVARDTAYRALRGAAHFDSAEARLARATAPVVRGSVRLTVPDTMFHAEGIAYDGRSRRWFVGSVRQRRIVAVDANGKASDFVSAGADGLAGVFGMAIDERRRTLWVATTALPRMDGFQPADHGRAGIFGYDIDTGRLRRRVWVSRDSAEHTFGDVAVAPNGDVYASDSQAPWIHVLRSGADSLTAFLTHPLFRSLQGMAITSDGRTMFVADYSHGLARVDLGARTVDILPVGPGVTTLGVDGVYLHGRSLVAVQNGVVPTRVVRFCLDAALSRVQDAQLIDRNPTLADEPTLAAVVGDSVFYVATAAWEKFADDGRRIPGTMLRPATVVGASLAGIPACGAR